MHNDKESPYTLTLLDDHLSLQVVQFSGHEALNQPYRFDIEVIGLAPALNLERLLQQPALLDLGQGLGIHGVLHSASCEHRGRGRIGYRLVLVPALQALDRYRSRRVFQRLSVPMILRQLLEEHDLHADSYRLELADGHYPLRPFCIQYEETDLALLQRLCEEEGIHYHFEHSRHGHVLVLADDNMSFPQEPLLMPFHCDESGESTAPVISELFQHHDSQTVYPRVEAKNRGVQVDEAAANHAFSHTPRPPQEQRHRDQLERRDLQRMRCQQLQLHGQSNQPLLRSACIVQVADHPVPGFNDQWLVCQARHQGQQGSILSEDSIARRYRNQFTAIPWSTIFRPPLDQARPRIPGFQPARVCGLAGQQAKQDDQGRLQVSVWPDTNVDPEAATGLWLPVAMAMPQAPGQEISLPTAGSDGWVSFLDSDPDRPVFCASSGQRRRPPAVRADTPRSDTRLLLDWLISRTDPAP
ncbi:type VI secretion system tip protein VgrG [Pseudomonas sp. WJP1]|uniref:type VI secretion system Vgr family protein n=1 Tax=Pseudomonas sp. WJP1 TaxID=2986947 RepID=UPI00234B0AED|nr:type VI secretion system tip protein TssI/VgrG [Pseudomonas sp. WJP1]WCM49585.1 type VI secretion system tip protein VgrG [Pseudomonas sp. WJP1]